MRDREATSVFLFFLLTLLAFSCSEIFNLDLGIHLTSGEYIVRHHEIPRHNVFSHVNFDYPLQNDKWLFQVLIHAAHSLCGLSGLYLIRVAATLGIFCLLWKTLRLSAGPFLTTVVCLAALVVSFERLALRPELFSLLLAAGFLLLLERGRVNGWRHSLWILVPLYILWVNLHGFHVLGIVLVFAYVVGGFAQWRGRRFLEEEAWGNRVPGWVWCLALLLVPMAVVNPHGLRGAIYPLVVLRNLAGEWKFMLQMVGEFEGPLEDTTGALHIQLFKLMAALGLASMVVVHRRLSLAQAVVFVAVLAQALSMRRNLPFFALGAAPLLARNLVIVGERGTSWARESLGRRWQGAKRVVVAVLCSGMVFLSWWILSDRFYLSVQAPQRTGLGLSALTYPVAAVDFLLTAEPDGEVFNSMDVGGYFLWKAYPARLPFITGDTNGYGHDFLLEYLDIVSGRVDFNTVADECGIGYALLDHTHEYANALIAKLFKDPLWILVWLDGTSVVFLRETAGNQAIIEEHRLELSSKAWRETVLESPRPSVFDRWIPLRAHSPSHALYVGRILLALQQYAVAESVLVETRERWPREKAVLPLLGLTYYYTGQWDKAEEALLASVGARGDSRVARSYLGDLYLRSGNVAAALEQFEAGLRSFPDSPELALGRAVALRKQHRLHEAVRTLERIVEKNPDYAPARGELGSVCQETGDYHKAASHYAHLVQLRPQDAQLHQTLGLIYARALGMDGRALYHLKRSRELDPDGPNIGDVEREILRIERDQGTRRGRPPRPRD